MDQSAGLLPEVSAFALDIARTAGARALGWFRRPIDVMTKADESPVTEADRHVEMQIRTAIATRFPGHSFFGEEYGVEGSFDSPTWVIDPIDRTRSFISGSPLWGTLVALCVEQKADAGAIAMPALNESWMGAVGSGSWFLDPQGQKVQCRTRDCKNLSEAIFYTTSPLYFEEGERDRILELGRDVRLFRFGGDCYNYGLLASGHVDLVIENRLEPYDYMPLVPIIEEAGGKITDWEGHPLTLASGKRVIAAGTPHLHTQALKALSA